MFNKRKKISLIGAGNIGGTLAHIALMKKLGDIVLFDIMAGVAKGKALDLSQCTPVEGVDINLMGTNNYEDIVDSDVIIVTAGRPRLPGMSRDDLLGINSKIMKDVGSNIKKYSPNSFVICTTNPLDVMVGVLQDSSSLNDNMLVGMAGVLDSSRFRTLLAKEFGVSVNQVQAYVLGGHGDDMVPLIEMSNIAGQSLSYLLKKGKISSTRLNEILEKTRKGGGEIVSLLGRGSAFYAPATSSIAMAESYLFDKKNIFPCAAKLNNGEYGSEKPLFFGVPVKIGANGVEEIIEVDLTDNEKDNLNKSMDSVVSLSDSLK